MELSGLGEQIVSRVYDTPIAHLSYSFRSPDSERVSHDILSDDVHHRSKKRKKRSRWSLGVAATKKKKRVAPEEEEGEAEVRVRLIENRTT